MIRREQLNQGLLSTVIWRSVCPTRSDSPNGWVATKITYAPDTYFMGNRHLNVFAVPYPGSP